MDRIDSMKQPAKWAAAVRQRAEVLSSAARDLSAARQQQPKMNPAQRVFCQYADRLESVAGLLRAVEAAVQRLGFVPLKGQALEEELSSGERLVREYGGRSALYLLMCSQRIVQQLQESGRRLRKAIQGLSEENLLENAEVERVVGGGEFVRPSSEDEALMDSLEDGMLDTIVVDNALCSKLGRQIAGGVGMELGSAVFNGEIEKLRGEKSAAESRGGKVHTLYLEQFLLVLDRAVQYKKLNEEQQQEQHTRKKEMMNSVSISGRDAPMLPLQPFICPITRDVMRDPVQIGSGQTYEREAIERWFSEGNTRCPVMGEELVTTQMKSNFALKQSIAEWRERNFEARLHGVARNLMAGGDELESEVQLRMVREVRTVCEQEPLNKYKVGAMGLVSPVVKLVESRDAEVRKETLAALAVLARDNLENQESMVKEGIIEQLVYSLTRQKADLQEAVLLMRILSEFPNTAERISHAQGAVVFLVTLLGCEDQVLNQNVKAILENVPISDENVVIMAEANLMLPLAKRIVEGSVESRVVMAEALAGMHLPVSSKTSVATADVIQSLLKMIAGSFSEESDEAALGALQNLTSVPSIAETVLSLKGFKQLEHKLNLVKTSETSKVGAARILADLSTVAGDVWEQNEASLNELEVSIYKFLRLMGSLAPQAVQAHVLQALLRLSNGKSVGELTMQKLGENKAMEFLLPLLKRGENPARKPAMELFCLLSKKFSRDAGAAVKQKPEIMSELLRELSDDPQRGELLGIAASVKDDDRLIEETMQEQPGFVRVVTGIVVDPSSQDIESSLKLVLKMARLGGVEVQQQMAEAGLVERLVQLLEAGRNHGCRIGAAWVLAEMARHSRSLIEKTGKKKKKKNGFVVLCLPWLVQRDTLRQCKVHRGQCTARGSFCLVEAEAVAPLVGLLREAVTWKDEVEAAAGALAALATLTGSEGGDVEGEVEREEWREGCAVIDKWKGVAAVIAAVSGGGVEAQRYALGILERVFEEGEYCTRYAPSAQMHVIYAAQTGDLRSKRIAGRILRRMDLIHSQSNYLAVSATM